MNEDIVRLLEQEESPILEFKRQWYWDDSTPSENMSVKWGEFLKDIISLANAYHSYVGQNRYLVFGFCENQKKLYNIEFSNIRQLKNISNFKKDLIQKLERHTRPALINFNISRINYSGFDLLIFEIPSPIFITETKKELQTKTRSLDEGVVLVRKGQKSDEVRTASMVEMEELKQEFEEYRKEFLKNKNSEDENTKKPERSIEKTIQLYIDKNSSFSLAENFPVKVKKWKDNIIYEVYKLIDRFSDSKEFIYLHENTNQGKTLGEIKRNNLVSDFSRTIILIDKPNIKDVDRRKENIRRLFGTNHVFFIDEFGYEHLYKDCILPYEKFNLPVYVNGLYDNDNNTNLDLSAIERLKEWFNTENEPLFVVSGHGGIGKTTLAKQFLDYVHDEINSLGILFIDSKKIISELSRNYSQDNKISDVFDFYNALMEVESLECSKFSKDLLKLSIDNGSLVIVLDGIDEVIAKLGDKFDIETFINSIFEEYSSGLHRTKILITCRDHFWNEVGKKILLPEITLKAFNSDLATEFFSKKLFQEKKINKAMALANKLAIETKESESTPYQTTYIPFLLDMIGYLIESDNDDIDTDNKINSQYLDRKNHLDVLVAQICAREIVKLDSLSIDHQIKLFISMASSKKNSVSITDIKQVLKNKNVDIEIDNSYIDKIKGHPLILYKEEKFYFRYDVFDIYFKSLLVSEFFNTKDLPEIEENIFRIISGYLKFDTSFSKSISEKVILDDDLIIFCLDLIDNINTESLNDKNLFISAIVTLLLTLLEKGNNQSNINTRTDIIEKIFEVNGCIQGLCLIDIFGKSSSKPTFDFRGKVLKDCIFINYEYFWECTFDDSTRFHDSYFKDIDPREGISTNIPEKLFSPSCDLIEIQHLISQTREDKKDQKQDISADLIKVFKLFYERGNFYPRKQEQVRKKLSTVNLLGTLIEKGVVKNYRDPKKPTMKQYRISDEYREIIYLLDQNTPSVKFNRLVKDLM
ncbi:NACHT domain-containing protein [Psychrobacter aestuarii]|uniref:Nephrocystin 3-like N-terminal domain-containing protein n=1 Tax=Psychrobacter aestuarii TaxID=556327 RepID=A0ABN0VKN5_9GAMM|nr:NACHT domain-containing protein [Psychrobacter aestuarii]